MALVLLIPLLGVVSYGCSCEEPSASAHSAKRTEAIIDRPTWGLPPEIASRVVARIDERELTVLDFADELARRPPAARARFVMPAHRAELLERLVDDELLADEARRRGHDRDPAVAQARRTALVRQLAQRVRETVAAEPVPEEELRARYESEPTRWNRPEMISAQVIAVARASDARRVIAIVRRASEVDRAMQQAAQRFAIPREGIRTSHPLGPFPHPDAPGGGDPSVPEPVARAAFATPPGAIHPQPVAHEGVFYVVRTLTRAPETRIPFERAMPLLLADRIDDAVRRRLDAEAQRIEVHVDEAVFAQLRDPFSARERPDDSRSPP
ncbi:MAG: peptidyl-prolyl cis-trans isomerase [Myxococcota bacterium]|nr:peptidyl-prolyl cis-trans isomerase [Myxococcota bacterium]MDW8361455.1 peptidyl-prolyl cis-trans isomerase [Myxococcales bacterium]